MIGLLSRTADNFSARTPQLSVCRPSASTDVDVQARSHGPRGFRALDVLADILGWTRLVSRPAQASAGQVLLANAAYPSFGAAYVKQEAWMAELGLPAISIPASLALPDFASTKGADCGAAAHEAFHAWIYLHAQGGLYRNEKIVNILATRWLTRNLSGFRLHAALEIITLSKISYGHN